MLKTITSPCSDLSTASSEVGKSHLCGEPSFDVVTAKREGEKVKATCIKQQHKIRAPKMSLVSLFDLLW